MKLLRNLSMLALASGLLVFPLAAAVGAALFIVLAKPVRAWRWPAAGLTVVAAAILSALASDWKLDALSGAGAFLLLGVGLYFLYTRFASADTPWAASGAALGLLGSAALAAYQVRGGGQAVAFTYHPNIAAALFTVGVFGMLGVVVGGLHGRSWSARLLWLVWLLALAASLLAVAFTGSRSGLLGLGTGAVVLLPFAVAAAWRRFGGWLTSVGVAVAAAVLGLLIVATIPASSTGNLVVNSGFEAGTYPWKFGGASERVSPNAAVLAPSVEPMDGTWVARLSHSSPGWQVLLSSGEPVRVNEDQAYVVSLYAMPAASGISGTFLRVDARDESGAFLARAGREAWTTGVEESAGGRWQLPILEAAPEGSRPAGGGPWQRFEAPLPPLPAGTSELTITIAADSREPGTYGLIDALQVNQGTLATAYQPGPSAGVRAYLGPLVPRLLALRDPIAASGGRISMWYFSLELAAQRPFLGYGFGVVDHLVQPLAPRYVADPLDHPHSFYFQRLLEGGALLLLAVLGWFGLVGWRLLRSAVWGSWPAATALGALVALLVQSVFDPVLAWGPAVGVWWVLVCGVGDEGGS